MSRNEEPGEKSDGDTQNHFCWDLESLMDWTDFEEFLEVQREHFNFIRPHRELKRFRIGLLMAYVMFTHDLEGWANCLDNAILVMEHTRKATTKTPLMNLPLLNSPLWKGSFEDFLAYIPESTFPDPEWNGAGEGNVSEQEADWNSFKGFYISAEHIAFSLKATMLTKVEEFDSAGEIWERIVPVNGMTHTEKAGICYIKAATFRCCGTQGMVQAIGPLSEAVLLNPDKLLWTLKLIQCKGWVRHINSWGKAEWAQVENIIKTVDSVLKLELEPWMTVKFQYEKFEALQDFLRDPKNRYNLPASTRYELYDECSKLADAIVQNTKDSQLLGHCAMFYSKDRGGINRAVEIIDDLLRNDPRSIFINSKATTIYYKANKFDEALKCAEIAAEKSVGAYMQLLGLKTKLGHSFDLEIFFSEGLKKYQQVTDRRTIHSNAFIHYTSRTNHFKRAIGHFKKLLDSEPPEEFYRMYNVWINSMIHTGEAAYNVIRYVMSGDETYADEEYDEDNDLKMIIQVREDIKARFDVESFESHGLTPKEYLRWFKTKSDPQLQKLRYTEIRSQPRTGGGNFANNGRRENGQHSGSIASQSQGSSHRGSSTLQDWRSRSHQNAGSSNPSPNNRQNSAFGWWQPRSGESASTSSERSQARYTGQSQHKYNRSNRRARDNTSHDS